MLVVNYPTKKELKTKVGQPLRYQEVSPIATEYRANGRLTVCNRPHITGQKREFFAVVTMREGLIERVD